MKKLTGLILAASLCLLRCGTAAEVPADKAVAGQKSAGPVVAATTSSLELKDFSAKLSYAIGMQIGMNLKSMGEKIDLDIFLRAVKDVLEDRPMQLSEAELDAVGEEFSKRMEAQMQKRNAEREKMNAIEGEKNRKEGEAFLAENKKKPGVKTTASGLQYLVLSEGKGPKPQATDRVRVHYRGTLLNGKEFDSSYKRGQPAEFPLNRVIPGWSEGVQLMNVGSKYRLFVPSELGYRDQSPSEMIGPNSTLVFEVELLEIVK
ncbi:MAG: FKBP-type peptidyl-prolyl cis-trans isomerase [Candidatus Sumerlaeia bacterium]|nr:FKBP-type peptidyl-prolyl cis-trans isomerase [Candidatus Sumerlaeia bacterium]